MRIRRKSISSRRCRYGMQAGSRNLSLQTTTDRRSNRKLQMDAVFSHQQVSQRESNFLIFRCFRSGFLDSYLNENMLFRLNILSIIPDIIGFVSIFVEILMRCKHIFQLYVFVCALGEH